MLKVSVNSMAAVNDGRTILRSNYVSNAHEQSANVKRRDDELARQRVCITLC